MNFLERHICGDRKHFQLSRLCLREHREIWDGALKTELWQSVCKYIDNEESSNCDLKFYKLYLENF